MPENRFSHIDLRVPDMKAALPFYERFLPALGFTIHHRGKSWQVFDVEREPQAVRCFFGLTEEPGHLPNANRIAFWAPSRQEVDRVAALVRQAGGRNIEGPELCLEYSPNYYAVFFEDPCGNRLEVCCLHE